MAKLIKSEEATLLWSDDPNATVGKKKKTYSDVIPAEHTLKVRLEKNKRGGKTVSVVFELPENPDYFKKLTKKLKSFCGTGGAFKAEQIEIQGDHRQKIKTFLEKEGFSVKLAGG